MEDVLKQAFLYYDRDGDEHLSLEDTLTVLRSANVAVDLDDVTYFMNAEYAGENEVVSSVSWDACRELARLYSERQVGKAKVHFALKAFEVDNDNDNDDDEDSGSTGGGGALRRTGNGNKKVIKAQELRHCLRALTPASMYVTGADVAAYTLKDVAVQPDGTTTAEHIVQRF